MMKTTIALIAMLAAAACATQPEAPFQTDADGYFRLPLGATAAYSLDTEKIGTQMAAGEMYCRERGQTAETGFVVGPNGAFIRFRCVDEAPAAN
jgi:hypothetical protein